VDALITDDQLSPQLVAAYREAGVKLFLASAEQPGLQPLRWENG
jgi:hypothetical protein